MGTIRIIARPPGEAPEHIRDAWVGVELPLAAGKDYARQFRVRGVLTGPHGPTPWWRYLMNILTGASRRQAGYAVDALAAVDVLAAKDPAAADWWRQHCAYLLDGKRRFCFSADVCERRS